MDREDDYSEELSEIKDKLKNEFLRYDEIGGTWKTLQKMANLCQQLLDALNTDPSIITNKKIHKAVKVNDVLFELIEEAWIEHQTNTIRELIDSESPELTQEAMIEDSE